MTILAVPLETIVPVMIEGNVDSFAQTAIESFRLLYFGGSLLNSPGAQFAHSSTEINLEASFLVT